MTSIPQALDALDVAAVVRQAVLDTVERRPALLYPTRARGVVTIVPEDGAQIAIHAEKKLLAVALEADRADDLAAQLDVGSHKRGGPTWYLAASSTRLAEPSVTAAMIDAGVEASERCSDRYVSDRAAGRPTARPDPGACPACNIELRPSGVCAEDTCPTND